MDGPKSLEYYLALFNGHHVPPATERCPRRQHIAAQAYIDSWHKCWRDVVREYAGRIPPLDSAVRVIGLIPARNEEFRIPACLTAIAHDVVSSGMSDEFELVILENGQVDEVGPTVNSVSNWNTRNHPSFLIHTLQHHWHETEKCPIAKARKLLADIAIYRVHQAKPTHPVFLLSEDADIERIQAGRMRMALTKLDKQPYLDAIRGPQERSIGALRQNHLALLERRSWQFAELLLSSKRYWPEKNTHHNFYWHRVVTAGSNVFFSAEVYALIGGYSDDVSVFEDMDIGQRISVLRGGCLGTHFVPRLDTIRRFSFRQESSIARVLLSLVNNGHLYGHDGTGFYDVDHIIKRPNATAFLLQELAPFARSQRSNLHRYERVLSDLYAEILRIFEVHGEGVELFRRVMICLGFKTNIYICTDSGDISFIDAPIFRPIQDLRYIREREELKL